MAEPSLLLWDVGGVLLSNAWDHVARRRAVTQFGLDGPEFERRHEAVVSFFESGRLDLDGYLKATVFNVPRLFSEASFREFMLAQSFPVEPSLSLARALGREGKLLMVALNNESAALNEHRIRRFHLTEVFDLFLSSCYTGRRKPDPEAYRYALQITQADPEEILFLDDRPENVEAAARIGLRTILVEDPTSLGEQLKGFGIVAG